MRVGKRERAKLRLEREQAKAFANAMSFKPKEMCANGQYATMWGRFFPALRPVGKPSKPWHYNGQTARKVARTRDHRKG